MHDPADLARQIGDVIRFGTIASVDYAAATCAVRIDKPVTLALRLRVYVATAKALLRWKPRIRLLAVALAVVAAPGAFTLSLTA